MNFDQEIRSLNVQQWIKLGFLPREADLLQTQMCPQNMYPLYYILLLNHFITTLVDIEVRPL